ncbi:MAG: hypothetical protein M0Z59_05785 [Nitrospiraceae bacterium]|nr:hypothetical protein [Nitrospiraceae bacterium]
MEDVVIGGLLLIGVVLLVKDQMNLRSSKRNKPKPASVHTMKRRLEALQRAESIIQSYGKVLENCGACFVNDIALLKHSKEEIKNALLLSMIVNKDNEKIMQLLTTGYYMLPSFQEIKPDDIESINFMNNLGRNIPSEMIKSTSAELNQKEQDFWRRYSIRLLAEKPYHDIYTDRVQQERKAYKQELDKILANVSQSKKHR